MEQEGERSYREGLAPALTTALFALGEAGGLRSLLTAREPAEVVSEPGPEAPVEAQV
ncbi:MAG: hypothetical protein HC893_15375 [Chloroflexaceae bacterium]|nr:hypothetical protein [Chloroflexaceae bacterium]